MNDVILALKTVNTDKIKLNYLIFTTSIVQQFNNRSFFNVDWWIQIRQVFDTFIFPEVKLDH